MRKTKAVAYGNNQEAVVRELTALEIDRLFDEAEQRSMTTLDNLLDVHDLTSPMLAAMVGVDVEKIVKMLSPLTPSEYAPVIDAAKEVNPDFFAVARNIKSRAEMLANLGKILGSNFGKPSADVSKADTPTPGIMD